MIKYKQAGWHYCAGTALQLISSRLGETIMERYVARQQVEDALVVPGVM